MSRRRPPTHLAPSRARPFATQISKLLIIPFVCLVEALWFGKRFTLPLVLSILVVVAGVAVV